MFAAPGTTFPDIAFTGPSTLLRGRLRVVSPTNQDAHPDALLPMISPLEMTLFLLLASVVGVVVFRYLNLPPMLGYLSVGIVVGPHAFGIVPDSVGAQNLAEFGVVFLMFSIGLEFSLAKLRAMRRSLPSRDQLLMRDWSGEERSGPAFRFRHDSIAW